MRLAQWSFWTGVVVIAVGGVIGIWANRDWIATTDLAWEQLVLQGIPQEWPTAGSYSRWGWGHPGPVFHYLLWLPWRLMGGAAAGLLVGMLFLHLGAVVLAWLTARSRSLALAVLAAMGLLIVWALVGQGQALLPWNPLVGTLLGGTLLVAAVDAAARGRWGTFLLLPIASVLVQAHVGAAILAVACVAFALTLALVRVGQSQALPLRSLGWSALVTVVLWFLPLAEAFPDGGNLRAILTTDTGPGLGWGAAARVISGAWSVPAYWWSGDAVLPESMAIPVLALVPLVAFVVAVVRADPVAVRAMIVGGAAALTAVPSVALADQPRSYLVAWLPAVVAIVLATSVWVLVKGSHERWVLLLAPALLIPAYLVSWRLLTEPPLAFDDATVRAAVAVAERDAAGGVHVSITPDSRAFEVMPGIATELRRRGIGVSGEFPTALPASLAGLIDQQPAGRRGLVVEFFPAPGEPVPAGWRVAAQEDPFTPDQWRELLRYRRMADDPALPERDRALATLGYEQVRAGRTAWRILLQDRA